jgi:serine/threonine protein kinase
MDENRPLDTRILDGYRLIRSLGRGGFGEVWLCRSEAMGGYHALKFISGISPDLLAKEHEALALYRKEAARLRSPHLMPIEHINCNESGLYYVMPLADGVVDGDPADPTWQPLSLAARIHAQAAKPQWFSSAEISAILRPLLEALQTLSDAGLVHRDVKPDNILYFNGQPCLGDISLLGSDASVITRRGTPGYVTPSWYVGGHPDMYGAAALLYTLLTGNLPDKMGRSAFLWPPQGEVSLAAAERADWKRLHAVIRRATDEKVAERFIDFEAMASALHNELPVKAGLPRTLFPALALAGILAVTVFVGLNNKQVEPSARPPTNRAAGNGQAAKEDGQQEARSKASPEVQPEVLPAPTSASLPAATASHSPPIIADSSGDSPSMRERLLKVIPSVIVAVSMDMDQGPDLEEYSRQAGIRTAYQNRDYSACLVLLDERLNTSPELRKNHACSLFRALLLKRLDRTHEVDLELSRVNVEPGTVRTPDGLRLHQVTERIILWEALGHYRQAEQFLSKTIPPLVESLTDSHSGMGSSVAQDLYNQRARMRILGGDFAGALADENAALALPPEPFELSGQQATPAQLQQSHLNTIVTSWGLLRQEFTAYADYLETNGSPEPKPDMRNLDDE